MNKTQKHILKILKSENYEELLSFLNEHSTEIFAAQQNFSNNLFKELFNYGLLNSKTELIKILCEQQNFRLENYFSLQLIEFFRNSFCDEDFINLSYILKYLNTAKYIQDKQKIIHSLTKFANMIIEDTENNSRVLSNEGFRTFESISLFIRKNQELFFNAEHFDDNRKFLLQKLIYFENKAIESQKENKNEISYQPFLYYLYDNNFDFLTLDSYVIDNFNLLNLFIKSMRNYFTTKEKVIKYLNVKLKDEKTIIQYLYDKNSSNYKNLLNNFFFDKNKESIIQYKFSQNYNFLYITIKDIYGKNSYRLNNKYIGTLMIKEKASSFDLISDNQVIEIQESLFSSSKNYKNFKEKVHVFIENDDPDEEVLTLNKESH